MDTIVQVNKTLHLDIAKAVTIQAHGKMFRIAMRNSDGSLTEHYCPPDAPGYNKLIELLTKAK